ncbi:putative alanine racemase-domain-containing protein [Cokeromyces recurvatus]|uniref:putative alanine racemase-domain-containing protein n=1 Tax=Cokeromyces recurvatus TaxID=90255 RepID=UPI002220D6B2|nr:putative alanine racemase-domain-containing protein [Cokeromyces recurvatus]KAI7902457.1 putative alanine racemase-domain-containing protein [Cokeromyces recurvatus]
MIQDTGLGQEMFISAYEKLDKNGVSKLHCNRYTDEPMDTEFNDQHIIQNEHLCERTLVYCVSPPGENQWSKNAHNLNSDSLSDGMNQLEIKESNTISTKKYPLPEQAHVSAIVKFYNDMGESIKVGQLIEVIGIRGQDLQRQQDEEEANHEFESVLNLFSDMPVIHAIAYNNLEEAQSSPLAKYDDIMDQANDIRTQLIDYIAIHALGGDKLAAEFVLLQLLSRITLKNSGLKIGSFTLNVSGFSSHKTTESDKKNSMLALNNPVTKTVADVLESLTVHSVNLPLTIDMLNKTRFSPKSVNENLEAGLLQLVDGTVLLVDETVLDEGKLVDLGVRNFQALQNLIQHQTLTYEFPYSQYNFDTDINVLSLSTSKSMLPNHCSIPLETVISLENNNREKPSNETLNLFRKFIHTAKYLQYDISDAVSEYIQSSFVNERKVASEKGIELPSQEDLMLRMNLARLAAVSFGENNLTQERYDYVVDLDKKRKARLSN